MITKHLALIASLVAVGATAQAAAVVVPGDLGSIEGNNGMYGPFSLFTSDASMRYQQVFDAIYFSQFPNGGLITEMDFRLDSAGMTLPYGTLPDIQINLSTTSKSADSLSPIFTANIGADDTVVFSRGPLALSGGGSFTIFDIRIVFNTPFLYRPDAGNLLLDVRNYRQGDSASHILLLDAELSMADGISKILANDVGAASATAIDSSGLVTQFQISPIPEPVPLALLLLGASVLAVRSKTLSAVGAEVTRLISPKKPVVMREPPHVGSYFFNRLRGIANLIGVFVRYRAKYQQQE